MPPEAGSLLLAPRPGDVGFDVRYRRPDLEPLLVGRAATDAEALTARLHPLCGDAHGVAFARAMAQAASLRPSSARRAAWDLLLVIEQAEAMARRVAIDLPRATGEAPRPHLAKAVLQAARDARHALGLSEIRGSLAPKRGHLPETMAILSEAFDDLVQCHGEYPTPTIDVAGSGVQMLVEEAWSAPRDIADRIAAVVTDAGELRDEPAWDFVAEGSGSGATVTIRGRLTTRLELSEGEVQCVRWTTPTDRLFGDTGPGTLLLNEWSDGPFELSVVMTALDPCVPWRALPAQVDA